MHIATVMARADHGRAATVGNRFARVLGMRTLRRGVVTTGAITGAVEYLASHSQHIAYRPTLAEVTERRERAMSFGSIAEDYDQLRPRPPRQAVDWLVPSTCEVAVDVGAGTGLFTRTLVGRVPEVIAVEPDARMRNVLMARSPEVRVVEGRGESIPLPDAAADAVFVSSAWHWMDPERAVPEIGRVVRDGGRFGLLWTSRDREVDWVRNLDRLPGGDKVDAQFADRFRQRLYFDLPEPRIFDNVEREVFRFSRAMTVADAVGMLGTYSRAIVASPDDRAQALDEARVALKERFPGTDTVEIPMRTWCWRADRIARGG